MGKYHQSNDWQAKLGIERALLAEGGAESSGGTLQGVEGDGRREGGCRRGRRESCPVQQESVSFENF